MLLRPNRPREHHFRAGQLYSQQESAIIKLQRGATWRTVIADEARLDAAIVTIYLVLLGALIESAAAVLRAVVYERLSADR